MQIDLIHIDPKNLIIKLCIGTPDILYLPLNF